MGEWMLGWKDKVWLSLPLQSLHCLNPQFSLFFNFRFFLLFSILIIIDFFFPHFILFHDYYGWSFASSLLNDRLVLSHLLLPSSKSRFSKYS
jgi:hypothetical protein